MRKEFNGADFFACRCATAPRMGGINADTLCNALGYTRVGTDCISALSALMLADGVPASSVRSDSVAVGLQSTA